MTLVVHRCRRTQPRHPAPKVDDPVRLMILVRPAGQVAVRLVWFDGEVVNGEPARHRRTRRCGFDAIEVTALGEFSTQFPGALSRISEHRDRFRFPGERLDAHRGVPRFRRRWPWSTCSR